MCTQGYDKKAYCKPWVVNTLTVVCGVAALIFGCGSIAIGSQLIAEVSNRSYSTIFPNTITEFLLPALLILFGIFMIIIAVAMLLLRFVLNAAVKYSVVIAITLIILAIAVILVGTTIFAVKDSSSPYDRANVTFKNYLSQEDVKMSWNHVQETIQCCGIHDFNDYATIFNNSSVPVSCCNTTAAVGGQNCSMIVMNAKEANISGLIFSKGCVFRIQQLLADSSVVATAVGSTIGGIIGVIIMFALILIIGYCWCRKQCCSGYDPLNGNCCDSIGNCCNDCCHDCSNCCNA